MGIWIQNGGGMVRTDSGGGQKMPLVLFRVRDYNFLWPLVQALAFIVGNSHWDLISDLCRKEYWHSGISFNLEELFQTLLVLRMKYEAKQFQNSSNSLCLFFPPYIFHIYYYRCSLNGLHVHDVRFPTQPRLGEVHMGSWCGSHRLEGETPVF